MNTETDAIRSTLAHRVAELTEQNKVLVDALEGLFEHCSMIHKHWGEGSNAREAQAAIDTARAALKK